VERPLTSSITPVNGWRRLIACLALAALPLVLALAGYYRLQLAGAPLPYPQGDAAFYAYQLVRAAECHGQWWRVVDDPRLGPPYPTEFAKHPGLYEGVDLMLLATVISGALDARFMYHAGVLTAIVVNGWIAAWIVWRATRSFGWAAMAVLLITLNQSLAIRIQGHLHLFKFGWVLLTVAAFVAFTEQPQWRRGLLLGVAASLLLSASFYLGFLVELGLAFWCSVEMAGGRLRGGHAGACAAAVVTFLLLTAALCFPVWTATSPIVASSRYFHREWAEIWGYGSELWKYLVPMGSWLANTYFRDIHQKALPPLMDEGWHFPGYTILLGVFVFSLARLRRSVTWSRLPRFVSVWVGLMAFWTVLSLSGGPSVFIYYVVPCFRCYGRAGLLVLALGAVVAPIVLCQFVRTRSGRLTRVLLTIGLSLLAASDGLRAALFFPGWRGETRPVDWAIWLKNQPPDLRLAVFTPARDKPFDSWGLNALSWLFVHGHATLNGADFALFEGDLQLLGASHSQINPAALKFVVSLGYEALAFDRSYLDANPWIRALPWLDHVEEHANWLICRASPRLSRLPGCRLDELLNAPQNDPAPRIAPPDRWVTQSWPVGEDVVVTGSDWAFLVWTDEHGKPLADPKPALYQHVFGPSAAAYSIRTPKRVGSCRLVIQDRNHRARAAIPYRIVAQLEVAQPELPAYRSGRGVCPVALRVAAAGSRLPVALTLSNPSPQYVQSRVFREFVEPAAQTHPGIRSIWPRANDGGLVLRVAPHGADVSDPSNVREIPLPQDLPPGGNLSLALPSDRLPASWANLALDVEPVFTATGQEELSPLRENVRIAGHGQPGSSRAHRASKLSISCGAGSSARCPTRSEIARARWCPSIGSARP
jgi:hypothetical protein